MNGSGSTSTGYTLTSYVADASVGAKPVSEETRNFPGSITANVFKGSNQVSFPYYLDFSTPFGKLWVLDVKCGATGSGCTWRKDTTQTGDYKPYPNVSEIQNSDKLYFEITNGKYSRKVWVNANGDSYIE
jgi:hypothetical protein